MRVYIFISAMLVIHITLKDPFPMTVAIFPQPKSVVSENGQFEINAQTRIQAPTGAEQVAEYLANILRAATGFALLIDRGASGGANTIALSLDGSASLGKE